jgi:UDP-3-O-[3-hydroxymyristoyl] glucosamine N-acyltransferase
VRHLQSCQASAILVPSGLLHKQVGNGSTNGNGSKHNSLPQSNFTIIEVKDALAAFVVLMRLFRGEENRAAPAISAQAVVHPSAQVGPDTSIAPFAVVGEGAVVGARCQIGVGVVVGRNCRIGDDAVLYPRVVLYDGTILGKRVAIHAGAIIGADGFGYRLQDGKQIKVPQFGVVEIGDDVEIGANTTVDRGTFHNTRIGAGTKIDNLVQIGHNCQIGQHNLLVSQVGIAGSCSTGDYVVLAGQVGVADHVHIGNRAMIGAKSGLHRDVADGERMLGAPAHPEGEQKRILLCLEKLPDLRREVRQIRHQLGLENAANE